MTYVYKDPLDRGYKLAKVDRKTQQALLPRRKLNILKKWEWYISEDAVEIHFLTSFLGKVLVTLMFPVAGFVHGFGNKELYNDYKRMYWEKKYGSFSSDKVFASQNREFYNEVLARAPLIPIKEKS